MNVTSANTGSLESDADVALAHQSNSPITFLQLRIEPWSRFQTPVIIVLFGLSIAIIFGIATRAFSLHSTAFEFVVAVALGIVLAAVVVAVWVTIRGPYHAVWRAFWTPEGRREDPQARFQNLAALLQHRNYPSGLALAARQLVRRGERGVTVRYEDTNIIRAIDPITVGFEPCTLDEVDSSFRGIAIPTGQINESDERSETRRRIRRAWRMGGLGFVAFAAFQCAVNGYRAVVSGFVPPDMFFWVALLGLAVFFLLRPVALGGRVLLVPGAILHRCPHWFSAGSRSHLYLPAASVLITYPIPGRKWGWVLADKTTSTRGIATELEIRTLLRAWLSPLPPPTPEMLRGLAGE